MCEIRSPRYIVVMLARLLLAVLGTWNKASVTRASSGTRAEVNKILLVIHYMWGIQEDRVCTYVCLCTCTCPCLFRKPVHAETSIRLMPQWAPRSLSPCKPGTRHVPISMLPVCTRSVIPHQDHSMYTSVSILTHGLWPFLKVFFFLCIEGVMHMHQKFPQCGTPC